ncbi:MAG TPA: GNAT family N-acetyltransferase [Bacteroidia bacterium]|nr:GNAT family N-acetyltransferase [Bacteroidia bacterium]
MASYFYPDKLSSTRLISRKLTLEDIKPWTAFFEDAESVEFIPSFGMMTAEERSIHWIERQLARYKEASYGLQALIDKNTNQFVGQCGLLKQDVNGITEIEVGYHILKTFRGNGFATEAARMFINFAFENNQTHSVVSIIDLNNLKSQRVADKNSPE